MVSWPPIDARTLIAIYARWEFDGSGAQGVRHDTIDAESTVSPAAMRRRIIVAIVDSASATCVDLRPVAPEDAGLEVDRAIGAFAPLILGAVLAAGDLVATPPLLRLDPTLGYVVGRPVPGRPSVDDWIRATHEARVVAALRLGPGDGWFAIGSDGVETMHALTDAIDGTNLTAVSLYDALLAEARKERVAAPGDLRPSSEPRN